MQKFGSGFVDQLKPNFVKSIRKQSNANAIEAELSTFSTTTPLLFS